MDQDYLDSARSGCESESPFGAMAGGRGIRPSEKESKSALSGFSGVAFFLLAILTQLFCAAISFNLIELIGGKAVILDSSLFRGNIFFSGEISGEIGPNGCDRLGSASRRVRLLERYPDSLYCDNGNFSSPSQQANDLLIRAFKQSGVAVVNLTGGDIADLGINKIFENQSLFISTSAEPHIISTYRNVVLRLKNKKGEDKLLGTFITGYSESGDSANTAMPSDSLDTTRSRAIHLIDSIEEYANRAQLKILLFNADFLALDKVLREIKIRFDLVVCQSSPFGAPNRTTKIQDTPIVYPDRLGKSIARVEVIVRHNRKYFRIDYIKLFQKMPLDIDIEDQALRITGRS